MTALVIIISMITFFALGKLVGRAETIKGYNEEFRKLERSMTPDEQRVLTAVVKRYLSKWY